MQVLIRRWCATGSVSHFRSSVSRVHVHSTAPFSLGPLLLGKIQHTHKHNWAQSEKKHSSSNAKRLRRIEELEPHRELTQNTPPHRPPQLYAKILQRLEAQSKLSNWPTPRDEEISRIKYMCEQSRNEFTYFMNVAPVLLQDLHAKKSGKLDYQIYEQNWNNPCLHGLMRPGRADLLRGFHLDHFKVAYSGAAALLNSTTPLLQGACDMGFAYFTAEAKYRAGILKEAEEQNEKNRIIILSTLHDFFVKFNNLHALHEIIVVTMTLKLDRVELFLNWAYPNADGKLVFAKPVSISKWSGYDQFPRARREIKIILDAVRTNTLQIVHDTFLRQK